MNTWINCLRWTDDIVRDVILGFGERGLENEGLFVMYVFRFSKLILGHNDHGTRFLGEWTTPINNSHNEAYRVPFLLYNANLKNPEKKKIEGNFYLLSIPTTFLDLMTHTKSFKQKKQQKLASQFAANYEFEQSLLRPIQETIRLFGIAPGGGAWTFDNGRNLRVCRHSK